MRAIVHIGPMKTGTTALQEALASHRPDLRTHGILYPQGNDPANHVNHNMLAVLVLNEDTWRDRRWLGAMTDTAAMRRRAASYWDAIRREVDRHRPQTLVLSTERLGLAQTPEEFDELRRLVSEVCDDITVSLYIRDPADRWLSHFQQVARHSSEPRLLYAPRFRPQIEVIETTYGRRPAVRGYDRSLLVDGDIVTDFVTTFLAGSGLERSIPSKSSNEALSPEALAILVDFRRFNRPGGRAPGRIDTGRLITDMRAVEARMRRGQPLALRSDIRAQLTTATIDLPWLRDEYGITFPSVDYDQHFDADALEPRLVEHIEDIVAVDDVRKRELLSHLLLHYTSHTDWGRVARDAATGLTPRPLLKDAGGSGNVYDRAWTRINRRRRWRDIRRPSTDGR